MSPASAGSRAGSALVEALVALILLAVGVLGLAGTTTVLARQVEVASLRHRLAVRAQNELERRMARARIPPLTEGGPGGSDLEWSVVAADARQLRLVANERWRSTVASDTLIMLLPR